MPRLTLVAACCFLAWASFAFGQDTALRAAEASKTPPSTLERPATPGDRVEESGIPVYYLKDKQGNLVPVPGMGIEEFDDLWKKKHQLVQGDQRPRYSIQQVSATGTVTGKNAEITFQFRIFVRDDQWTRVPLRLDQAVLREPPQFPTQGEYVLSFEGGTEGHVVSIRAAAGQQHQFTLKALVPLNTSADETRLRLTCARAAASELKLKVPLSEAVGKVSEGATLQTTNGDKDSTELTALGLNGDFELSWRGPGARTVEEAVPLEAIGTVLARLEGERIATEATLSVRSYGPAFERFRVRLPEGADLSPENAAGFTLREIEETGKEAATSVLAGTALPRRLVEVQLAKRTPGPVEVRLVANRACETTKPGTWLDVSGFEVVDAARQWGTVSVSAAGDWQVLWGPSRGIRQVEPLPETLKRKDVVAAFDYFAQPYALTARLAARKTRISVEPEYLLWVDGGQVRLEARLRYNVRGGSLFAVDLAMPDWRIDEIGPENLVAPDGLPEPPYQPASKEEGQKEGESKDRKANLRPGDGVFSIPLLQPSTGQFEVRISAHRELAKDTAALSVPLPQPCAATAGSAVLVVLPAALVVVPAEDVELIPGRDMAGLVRQPSEAPLEILKGLVRPRPAASLDVFARQADILFYRGEGANAVFAGRLHRPQQRVAVEVNSQIHLDGRTAQVEQKLAYNILHKSLDHFLLDVPAGMAEPGRLEVKHEGQTLKPVLDDATTGSGADTVRLRVPLPKACIRLCQLTVRYAAAVEVLSGATSSIRIPLVMPADGELSSNRAYVVTAADVHAQPRPGKWALVEVATGLSGQRRPLQLTADQRVGQIELDAQCDRGGQAALVIERAWVQTWFTAASRQDRAVFQFTGNGPEVRIHLPAAAVREQVSLALDGKRIAVDRDAEGQLVVSLPGDATQGRHVLEVGYHFAGRPGRGHMAVELPRLGPDAWIRRMYWQLVLPGDEHLMLSPDDFTGEFRWGWGGYFWGRQPLLDSSQLDAWAGAARGGWAAMPAGANCYLFSAMGNVAQGELHTATRSWIVLAASGAALIMGLLWIYLPAIRHPAALLAAALFLAALAAVQPEPALLLAQAAALGMALALVSGLMSHGLARRQRILVPLGERGSSVVEGAALSTQSDFQIPSTGSLTPSQVAPAPVGPPPDAEP